MLYVKVMLTAVPETIADTQLRTRTTLSNARGQENGQRYIGSPQEEENHSHCPRSINEDKEP